MMVFLHPKCERVTLLSGSSSSFIYLFIYFSKLNFGIIKRTNKTRVWVFCFGFGFLRLRPFMVTVCLESMQQILRELMPWWSAPRHFQVGRMWACSVRTAASAVFPLYLQVVRVIN